MARGGRGIFRQLLWPGAFFRHPAIGGLTVEGTTILALVMALGLIAYLSAALLKPEKFS